MRRLRITHAPEVDQSNLYVEKVLDVVWRIMIGNEGFSAYVTTESTVRDFMPFNVDLTSYSDAELQLKYAEITKELGIPVNGSSLIFELAAQLEVMEGLGDERKR
jgi:hypothetical protein